jgi:hypothetical protein
VIATRTGRHSVIAYRYDFRQAHFEPEMRSVVVPPFSMYGVGLTGGSHDTFGQLDAQFAVHLAIDAASTIYVACSTRTSAAIAWSRRTSARSTKTCWEIRTRSTFT